MKIWLFEKVISELSKYNIHTNPEDSARLIFIHSATLSDDSIKETKLKGSKNRSIQPSLRVWICFCIR